MALHVMRMKSIWRNLPVGGSVAAGLLKISPDFLNKENKRNRYRNQV